MIQLVYSMLVYTWDTLPSLRTFSLWHPLTTIPFLSPIYQHKERSQIPPLRHVISNQRQMAVVYLWRISGQTVVEGWNTTPLKFVVLGYPESDTLNPYHQILWPKRSSTQKCFRSKKCQITGLAIYTSRFEDQHLMHSLYPHHIISMSKFQCMMARSGLSFHGALGVMSPLRGAETNNWSDRMVGLWRKSMKISVCFHLNYI